MPAHDLDFRHDLFISYGCVDDQPGDNGQPGWVTCLVEDLRKRLSERLGRKDTFTLWRDEEQLLRHVDIEQQIADAVAASACLLVVLSPGYLISDWCRRERIGFLKRVRERDASGARVFVVERDWIAGDKPEEFQNLLGFRFWTGNPSNQAELPRPLDKARESDRDEYKDQLNRLALAVESELRRLKTSPRPKPARAADAAAPVAAVGRAEAATVFLAEVTDDLRTQWKKVHSELDQHGVRVVSGGAPRDVAALQTAVTEALKESALFVQLLSQFPGQPLPASSETYALLQYRLAVESQKRILQWRPPQLTEEVFDQQEAEDLELARQYRKLVFGRVRAEHIEDFKRHVIQVATETPRPAMAQTGLGTVFVSFNPDSIDSEFAEDLCGYLDQRGFGIVTPITEDDADPDVIRGDFEKHVLASRGWIVVYGEPKQKFWVRGQLNEINQLLCQHAIRGGAIHLCAAPPAPKDVHSPLKLVGMKLPRMRVIDCQNGFEVDKLFQFLDGFTVLADGVANEAAVRTPAAARI